MKIFISWSGEVSQKIASVLRDWIPTVLPRIEPWVSLEDIPKGSRWSDELRKALEESKCVINCIVPDNIGALWPVFEAGRFSTIFPFLLGLTPEQVSGPLKEYQCTEYSENDVRRLLEDLNEFDSDIRVPTPRLHTAFRLCWPGLKLVLDPLQEAALPIAGRKVKRLNERTKIPKDRTAGVVSPDELLKSKRQRRLTDEVFAIELLTQPVKLERDEKGHVTVTVNRHGVKDMLYTNAAKMATTGKCVTPENRERLLKRDREIQSFLADGGPPDETHIDLKDLGIWLRWASGGILSIVTDASGKQWVPLFFRDIRPYGWNIALGTTERWFDKTTGLLDENYTLPRDLNYPHTFIMREFLEETLIVTGTPQVGGTLYYKSFHFADRPSPFSAARARLFYEEHCRLRKEEKEDCLTIIEKGETEAKLIDTNCSLIVRSDKDYPMHGVLICFSLLDLGIEVVEVAEYKLEKGDWILDGEIREKHNAATRITEKELIRMPTALLSLEYLREIFGPGKDWHRYTFGPQPSIKVSRPPNPGKDIKGLEKEIKHFEFDWDVRRRMQAVEGEWDAKAMRSRYLDWYDKFGEHFIKDREKPEDKWDVSYVHPSQLFVPGTAKILNLYFSTLNREDKK